MKNYFDSINGNRDSIQYFQSAIASGKLAHAYILEGPDGSGRRTLAKAIAAARVCDSPYADKILSDQSPDFLCFSLPEKKKTIGVDTIRALKSAVYIKPSELDAKFFVITDCQLLTHQAQNAALKILEEPPHNVYFFLCTTSAAALLPTVRSRAQTIRMQIFGEDELHSYALKFPAWQTMAQKDPLRMQLLLRNANGCIGNLNTQTEDKDAVKLQENAKKLIALLDAGEYTPLLLFCIKSASQRQELDQMLLKTALGLRDVLAVRNGTTHGLQLYPLPADALGAAKHMTEGSILSVITAIEKIREQLISNPNLKGAKALLADTLMHAMQN